MLMNINFGKICLKTGFIYGVSKKFSHLSNLCVTSEQISTCPSRFINITPVLGRNAFKGGIFLICSILVLDQVGWNAIFFTHNMHIIRELGKTFACTPET